MALTINALTDETASVTFEVGKESVTVTYYPGRVLTNTTQEIIQRLAKEANLDMFDSLLCQIIKSWDVLDYDEISMFPLLPERVASLPVPFRMKVLKEIVEASNQNNHQSKPVHYLN